MLTEEVVSPSHSIPDQPIDCRANALKMYVHIIVAEPHDLQAQSLQIRRSRRVLCLLLRLIVLGAVDLDHQPARRAIEVIDIVPELLLTAEPDRPGKRKDNRTTDASPAASSPGGASARIACSARHSSVQSARFTPLV